MLILSPSPDLGGCGRCSDRSSSLSQLLPGAGALPLPLLDALLELLPPLPVAWPGPGLSSAEHDSRSRRGRHRRPASPPSCWHCRPCCTTCRELPPSSGRSSPSKGRWDSRQKRRTSLCLPLVEQGSPRHCTVPAACMPLEDGSREPSSTGGRRRRARVASSCCGRAGLEGWPTSRDQALAAHLQLNKGVHSSSLPALRAP